MKVNLNIRYTALCFALACLYFLIGKLSLSLAFEPSNTSPVWLPTGIAIAAMMYFGRKAWLGVFIGALLTNLSTSIPLEAVFGIATGNTLEALIATALLRHLDHVTFFDIPKNIIVFALAAAGGCALGAMIGLSSLYFGGVISGNFGVLWLTWWLGNVLGALIVTPFLLIWASPRYNKLNVADWVEIAVIATTTSGLYLILFSPWFYLAASNTPVAFILMPLAVWSAYRFHLRGSTLFVLATSTVAITATINHHGPFSHGTFHYSLLLLQIFIALVSMTILIIAAHAKEKYLVSNELQRNKEAFEEHIADHTADLQKVNKQLILEVDEHKNTMNALHALLDATAADSHTLFLSKCVKDIAAIYKVKFAFIGTFVNNDMNSIKTLSVWAHDDYAKNFKYSLRGTPCQDVIDKKVTLVPKDAATRYPDDELLVTMGIDSYFGAPLVTQSGETLGIIAVMDDKEMTIQVWSQPILALYANSIASELEHKASSDERKLSEAVFNSSAQAIAISDKNGNILRVNNTLEHITGYCSEELIGENFRIHKSGLHDATFYRDFWKKVISNGHWYGEMWNKKKNGDIYAVWQTVASVQDADSNIVNFVSIFSDISEKKADDQHIFNLAHFDVLTGLCNRSSFQSQLEKFIAHANRQHTIFAIIFLDLDNFKNINDASGHAAGDKLLCATADRLSALVRETDIVARLGGDEFVILINNYANTEALARVSKKIINTLSQPLMLDTTEVVVSASLGISTYPLDGTSTQTLLQNADSAMYQAKSLGRNNYQFFTQDMNRLAKERLMIEADLRKALENGELILHYQPQVHNPSQRIIGCEALVRWNHPQRGLIPPLEFIPIAEESGQIRDIGEWVLNEACAQQARWEAEGFNDLKMSVNISARQFTKQNIVDIVTKCLNRDNINASNLELEITESAIMENLEDTIKVLADLNAMGVQLAIDDFGTGYSSMAYLKTFPISRLKIDRSFVNDITTDADDAAIVKATISLCKNLHLTVIAEGVETCEQVGFLQDSGCSEMQGYFFGKPVTADEFGALLRGPNYK